MPTIRPLRVSCRRSEARNWAPKRTTSPLTTWSAPTLRPVSTSQAPTQAASDVPGGSNSNRFSRVSTKYRAPVVSFTAPRTRSERYWASWSVNPAGLPSSSTTTRSAASAGSASSSAATIARIPRPRHLSIPGA